MDADLRPDLSRILPRPALFRAGGQAFRGRTSVPETIASDDYVVDFERRITPGPEDTTFDLRQAQSVADRINARLAAAPTPRSLFAVDTDRAHDLLG